MDVNNVGLRPKSSLKVLTRLNALYFYVYEMAKAFGVDSYALDSIEKGVKERQIIEKIYIKYRDENKVVIGKITISIDWEKHSIQAMTDEGKSFTISSDKSIHSQICEASDSIIEHVNCLRKSLPIKTITTSYRYTEDIRMNDNNHTAAMTYLGHVICDADDEQIDERFAHTLEHTAKHLSEVSITVSHI